ncbi:protein of unknown function [Cupriavidus taiwanensis]|nr:protein of unknown function [Cupriavidus taiwanensis]
MLADAGHGTWMEKVTDAQYNAR